MKKKTKIILIIVTIIILTVFVLVTFYMMRGNKQNEKKEEFVTEANDNSDVVKDIEVEGLKISNVMLIVEEEGSTFTADVTNNTNDEITGNLNIIFKTSTDKEVTSILGYFGGSIEAGETKQITSSTSRKLNKNIIKSINYELEK